MGESEKEAEKSPRFEIKIQDKCVLIISEPWHLRVEKKCVRIRCNLVPSHCCKVTQLAVLGSGYW